jgi:hypothetical protein
LGDQTESPIFIVGMPRSGTTLTAQVIGAHPQCISIGETDRFNRYRQDVPPAALARARAPRHHGRGKPAAAFAISPMNSRPSSVLLQRVRRRRVVEKSPSNTDSLGFIHLVFPKARFVHCRRHPADNFVSAFQHNMNRGHDYAYDQSAYVERYLAQEEIMRYWKSCFPEQVFEMRYEEMVAQPKT